MQQQTYIKILATIALGLQSACLYAQIRHDSEVLRQHSERIRKALGGTNFHENTTYYHALVEQAGKSLLTKSEIDAIHAEENELVAVIHIGPMKTGSSSIQSSFRSIFSSKPDEAIKVNNYEDAGRAMGTKELGVWNMVGCFRHPDASPDGFIVCMPESLSAVHQVAARRHNLVISAEYLTSPDTNVGALKDFLIPWKKQRVVAYYRRYYDWLYSMHNQGNKKKPTPNRHSLIDFLKHEQQRQVWWEKMYIVTARERWMEHFKDFEIFNIYAIPDNDVRDSFFCSAIPESANVCRTFRLKKAAAVNSTHHINPSVSFIYEDLAYYSKEMGLWSEEKLLGVHEVTLKAKQHQELHLNLTAYDFGSAVECPDNVVSNYLLERTLDTEKQLFSRYFLERGEKEIRNEFAKQIKTKLCQIHAKKVLEENSDWREFFMSLNS